MEVPWRYCPILASGELRGRNRPGCGKDRLGEFPGTSDHGWSRPPQDTDAPAAGRSALIGPERRRRVDATQRPGPLIRQGMPPVTVDRPRRSVRNRTRVPSARFGDTPQEARASCTPDLPRRDRGPAPTRWHKAARGQRSIATQPFRCPARQFRMLRRCRRPAGSPTIAPETPKRRCVPLR